MQLKDVMTKDPACCTPETGPREAARLVVEHDRGAIPVVESGSVRGPIGLLTDRDITRCAVAARRRRLSGRKDV